MQKQGEIGGFAASVIRVLALAVLAVTGCGSEKSDRAEAHAVLEAISRLDPNAGRQARSSAIEAVAGMPLADKTLQEMRTVCLQAHRGLLEAESAQASVRAALDSDPPPSADTLDAMETTRKQAESTLAGALSALDRCVKLSREATVRYR